MTPPNRRPVAVAPSATTLGLAWRPVRPDTVVAATRPVVTETGLVGVARLATVAGRLATVLGRLPTTAG